MYTQVELLSTVAPTEKDLALGFEGTSLFFKICFAMSSAVLEGLLGNTLDAKDGRNIETAAVLAKASVVGLYFAEWTKISRTLTRKLAIAYRCGSEYRQDMEIIFISSDESEESFRESYSEMPWLALPFSATEIRSNLMETFAITTLPCFVLVNAKTGAVISKDGSHGEPIILNLDTTKNPVFDNRV